MNKHETMETGKRETSKRGTTRRPAEALRKLLVCVMILPLIAMMAGCSKGDSTDADKQGTTADGTNPTADGTNAGANGTATADGTNDGTNGSTDGTNPDSQDTTNPDATPAATGEPVTQAPTPAPRDTDSVIAAYENFLALYAESDPDSYGQLRFTFAFIDEDDVPELVIARDGLIETKAALYRYAEDGEVTHVGDFGENGSFDYMRGKNVIRDECARTEYRNIDFYKIGANGEAAPITKLNAKYLPDDTAEYYVDGAEVTRDDWFAAESALYTYDGGEALRAAYFQMQPYADYCLADGTRLAKAMIDALSAGKEFGWYAPAGAEHLNKEWELDHFYVIANDASTGDALPAGGGTGNTGDGTGTGEDYLGVYLPAAEARSGRLIITDGHLNLNFAPNYRDDGFTYEATMLPLTYIEDVLYETCENTEYFYKASGITSWNGDLCITDYTDLSGSSYLEAVIYPSADDADGYTMYLYFR